MSKYGNVTIRKAEDRGVAERGWLHSKFSFSFADYYDPEHMGFSDLRVINDDIVEAGRGFDTHPHNDMEIVTYVVSGALEHKDSMGNGSVIRPGDIQRMTAGTGIMHSEFNPQPDRSTRLLQIWMLPEREGLEPGYEQIHVDEERRRNALTLVACRDGREGAVTIHQDAAIRAGILEPDANVECAADPERSYWLQVIEGEVVVNGKTARTGDGVAVTEAESIQVEGVSQSELLLFDLK